jgi:hypothetical protein
MIKRTTISITRQISCPCVGQKPPGGGRGPDLRNLNLCLLAFWVQRYSEAKSKIWNVIIDSKYQTRSPNIFCCRDRNASPFWKGVMWIAQAAKMGYRWNIGND